VLACFAFDCFSAGPQPQAETAAWNWKEALARLAAISTKKPPTQDPCIHRPCAASDATKQHNHSKLVFRISALFVEDSCWSIAAKQFAVTMSCHHQLPGFSMQPGILQVVWSCLGRRIMDVHELGIGIPTALN
jgi:hypothetical protein